MIQICVLDFIYFDCFGIMASTNGSGGSTPVGHGSRGPAPPLPEKPPSVAERTRLLKSSFRKEESERPKIDTNRSSPLAETPKSVGSSVSSLSTNGDREESPTPIINNVSSNTVIKPAPLLNSPVQDNRDVEKMMVRMTFHGKPCIWSPTACFLMSNNRFGCEITCLQGFNTTWSDNV